MPDLFGLDIAGLINDSITAAGGVLDATLTKSTAGTRTPGSLTAGTNPTDAVTSGKGFMDSLGRLEPGEVVQDATNLVTLIGKSFSNGAAVPEEGDLVAIEGGTYTILRVKRDPAAAVYECQVS